MAPGFGIVWFGFRARWLPKVFPDITKLQGFLEEGCGSGIKLLNLLDPDSDCKFYRFQPKVLYKKNLKNKISNLEIFLSGLRIKMRFFGSVVTKKCSKLCFRFRNINPYFKFGSGIFKNARNPV